MRILITVQNLELGGMEKMTTELALGLEERGHDLCVVGVYGGGPHVARLEGRSVRVYSGLARGSADPTALPKMWRICRRHRFDIAIAAMGGAMHAPFVTLMACKAVGTPCLRWMHTTPGEPLSRFGRVAQYAMTKAGNTVVGLTESHARALTKDWGIPAGQIKVIWNGQPLPDRVTPARRDEVRGELGLNDDLFVIGIVAAFRPVKRHEVLIQAFRRVLERLPSAHLLLVGDGPTRRNAEQLVCELSLGSRVTFTGARPDAVRLYAAMDVHAMCSYPAETFPLVVTEAMAAGVVQVAPAVGGIPEIVSEGQTGILVRPELPADLAEAIISLAHDPDRRARIAEAAHRFAVEHFSLDAMVDSFEKAMHDTLERSGAMPARTDTERACGVPSHPLNRGHR